MIVHSLKSRANRLFFKFKNIIENHLVYYPAPISLFYAWGIGSLIGILLIIQIATGVLLAMHYVPHIDEAFTSVERIMREVPSGWLLRYMHANGSSFLFILLYAHIARGLYYQSYKKPKQWVWVSGALLFILMAGIAFLGYTLPWGQMSFWGSTVITNMLTTIPFFGSKLVIWVWGGFAVNQNTLNRFFSLHYFLSIIALALSGAHLAILHLAGSTNPAVNETELDHTKFTPYFAVKDLVTLSFFLFIYFFIVFYKPNLFGHPDNYIRADALVTPAHIVPEWYFLPFYAMLKAFPNKAAGAAAMLCSMLILFTIPWLDSVIMGCGSLITDPQYKPGFTTLFLIFITNMLVLGWLGGLAVSDVNQIWMQAGTLVYFGYFLVIIPVLAYSEWLFLLHYYKAGLRHYKRLNNIDIDRWIRL